MKIELTKIKEELKAKVDCIDVDKESSKNENFVLKQSLEKTKHELLLQQNENGNLKSDIDSFKMKISQLTMIIESKERAYNELLMQAKEIQYQNDKLKIANESSLMSSYDAKNYTAYESPFRNYLPTGLNFRFGGEKSLDAIKTPAEIPKSTESENNTSMTKSVKVNLSDIGYKSKSKAEKYSSDSVSAALFWGKDDTKDTSPAVQVESSLNGSNMVQSSSMSTDLNQKQQELDFNLQEEKRLTELLRDPPVQYRKPHKIRELREDLKKAQKNIYDLKFHIKSKQF